MMRLLGFGLVLVAVAGLSLDTGFGSPQPAGGRMVARAESVSGVDPSFLNALQWRELGPHRGGRATAVAGHPDNPLIFYFGASHGGVWKTEDAGTYWFNVSDGYFNTAAIGAMEVARSNGSVIYVGTGESCPRQDLTPGDGVYKSTDGGETWTHVGLKETRHISKLRIDPTNPDIVYVAAVGDVFGTNPERGVFRTKDGGKTWERVLYKSEQAGAWDLTIDPTNPKVLYASLNRFQRLPWDQMSGGPDSGLYKTVDGGDIWTEITRRPGLPRGVAGKIGVAISPARPNRVWALVEAEDGSLFRSDDSGETWQRINDQRDLRRSAPSYNHVIPDTQDPDTVYVQSYSFWKSTDAGKTFRTLSMPHGDHHSLWIDPENSQRIIEGNDGGATVSLNGGATWSSILNQPTACLFGLAIDDQHPYRLYAAQNDNSHISTPSRIDGAAIAMTDHEEIPGGEGGETAVKPDGSVVYAGDRTRINRYDLRTGQAPVISVWPDDEFGTPPSDVKYRFYYTFPVMLSSHNPSVLYTAGNRVFRSRDEGDSWEPISPDITRNVVSKMGKIPGGPITSMASSLYYVSLSQSLSESPLEEGEIWVGTDDSTIQLTRDGGRTWENVSPKGLPEWTTISGIDVSPHDRGTAYVAANRYRVSDRTPMLLKTTDYGRNWEKITNGIREEDFARVIREDPGRRGLVYAGTEKGVYVSFDAGASWQSLQRNLPLVAVHYMRIKNDDLVLATHGRGFWIMDNVTALRQITAEVTAAPVHLFDIRTTYRYQPIRGSERPPRSMGSGIQYRGDNVAIMLRRGPDGVLRRLHLNAGENPPNGVAIEYYLKQPPAEAATLTVTDAQNEVVAKFSSQADGALWMPADAGTNRFVWEMEYPGARELSPDAPLVSSEFGSVRPPVAPPGRYRARLSVGGRSYERDFEIRRDPRIAATDEDLQAQFKLMTQIRDQVSAITAAVERLRAARDASASAATKEKLTAIEGVLTRVAGSNSYFLPPKGLNNKLAALSGVVGRSDARPTRPMYAVFEDLSARVREQLRLLDQALGGTSDGAAGAPKVRQ